MQRVYVITCESLQRDHVSGTDKPRKRVDSMKAIDRMVKQLRSVEIKFETPDGTIRLEEVRKKKAHVSQSSMLRFLVIGLSTRTLCGELKGASCVIRQAPQQPVSEAMSTLNLKPESKTKKNLRSRQDRAHT